MADMTTEKEKTFLQKMLDGAGQAIDRAAVRRGADSTPRTAQQAGTEPIAAAPLSPTLQKNKYHDVLLDIVADIAVEVGAPLDILVELHSDHRAKGYVVQMYREATPLQRASFRLEVHHLVVVEPSKIRPLVLTALAALTGQVYLEQAKPILAMPAPVAVPMGKPPRGGSSASHPAACVCKQCQAARKSVSDVTLARRPIDPTKVIDLGDRVLDLE